LSLNLYLNQPPIHGRVAHDKSVRDIRYIRYLFNYPMSVADFTFTANRVYLTPIAVPFDVVVDAIIACWGGTTPVTGNAIAGLYCDNGDTPAGARLIAQSPAVAKIGVGKKQFLPIDEVRLAPGLYWLAIESDDASKTHRAALWAGAGDGLLTYYYDLPSFGPLADPCPAVVEANAPILVGLKLSRW
jgi:hypothetical protein